MADPMIGRPFAMPMIKPFVPKKLQPWIYLLFAFIFQLSSGVYLGQSSQMVGDMALLREDVMMIGYFGVFGVAMPFPILFRLKFCYTNRQLLLFAATGILLCQLLVPLVTWVPLLCLLSYVSCFLKLMGTFECFSNIQLWITPKRDFSVFFPLIYIVILGNQTVSSWLAQTLVYHTGSWHAMHYFVALLLMGMLAFLWFCTQPFRFMKPIPFISIDWLGLVLWSAVWLQLIWLFNYGEYFKWADSALWRGVACTFVLTLIVAIQRMCSIRHPYIDIKAFQYKRLWPLLLMFVLSVWMQATPNVLQNVFTGGVMGWGMPQTMILNLYTILGVVSGCMFCLWWIKVLRLSFAPLLVFGFMLMLTYQVMMYFYITPTINIERLFIPQMLLNFGYAIFFVVLTIYLEEIMPFKHFFMGLTICGFVRNGVGGTIFSGIYSYGMRFWQANNLASGMDYSAFEALQMSIKQLYGITCVAGTVCLLLMLLWHVEPVRSTLKRIPDWGAVGKLTRQELKKVSRQRTLAHRGQ